MTRKKILIFLIIVMFISGLVAFAQKTGATTNLPDLIVKNIKIVDNCKLEITIANVGGGQISSSLYNKIVIRMFIDGKTSGEMTLSVFDSKGNLKQPGGIVIKKWFPMITKRRINDKDFHTIKVVVDKGNLLDEGNENNNALTKRLSCRKIVYNRKANLVVSFSYPPYIKAGRNFGKNIKVKITNKGTIGAKNFFIDLILSQNIHTPVIKQKRDLPNLNDSILLKGERKFIKYLAPQKTVSFTLNSFNTIPADIPSGNYYLKAVVDSTDIVSETNEKDNIIIKKIIIGNKKQIKRKIPDLEIAGFLKIGKYKKQVKRGETIILTPEDASRISNGIPVFDIYYSYGEFNRIASGTFENKIYFNGKLVSKQSDLRLNPSQIKDVHTQVSLDPQNGKLEIHIDADNEVKELREDNNSNFFINVVFKGFVHKPPVKKTPVKIRLSF